jgi:hypothetical protein
MAYLLSKLHAPFEQFNELPISFITFNYDRSLEHFLYTSLQSRYGKTEQECANVLERIPLIHLHGRLGYLPWQRSEGRYHRPYDKEMDKNVMETCIANIKIVHEDMAELDSDFQRAVRLLTEAECIYYLGFGYAPTNLDRLKIRSLPGVQTAGTGMGLTANECLDIVWSVGGDRSKINPQQGQDCIGLLRNYILWNN